MVINSKWKNYFFIKENNYFKSFWENYLSVSSKNLLFILGRGFDPRMNIGIKTIIGLGSGKRDCICLELDEVDKSPFIDRIEKNIEELTHLMKGKGIITVKNIKMYSDDNRLIGSKNAAFIISDLNEFSDYSDIIVDISSLPRIIFIPLIAKILFLLKNNKSKINLHVIVAENFALDEKIKSAGLAEEAIYIHGFSGLHETEQRIYRPTVWLPILGGGQAEKLEKIIDLVKPNEICPILPFPSRNPRRSDDLVQEYIDFFFNSPGIETSNIVYVDEQNPFEVYLQIYRTATQYNEALAPLGGCNIVVSPLSSKLLSLGALLATFVLNLALTEVPAIRYQIVDIETFDSELGKEELFELWLYGEPYE